MEFEITTFPDEGELHIRAWGIVEEEGFLAIFDAAAAEFEAHGYRKFLADYRETDPASEVLTVAMINRLADYLLPIASRMAPIASASVYATAAQFGMARLWVALSERADLDIRYEIFLDMQEAKEWLAGIEFPPDA